jgi:hypothetical protein
MTGRGAPISGGWESARGPLIGAAAGAHLLRSLRRVGLGKDDMQNQGSREAGADPDAQNMPVHRREPLYRRGNRRTRRSLRNEPSVDRVPLSCEMRSFWFVSRVDSRLGATGHERTSRGCARINRVPVTIGPNGATRWIAPAVFVSPRLRHPSCPSWLWQFAPWAGPGLCAIHRERKAHWRTCTNSSWWDSSWSWESSSSLRFVVGFTRVFRYSECRLHFGFQLLRQCLSWACDEPTDFARSKEFRHSRERPLAHVAPVSRMWSERT